MKRLMIKSFALFTLSLAAASARAALVDVGNGLVNHPDANITWVADTNLMRTLWTTNPNLAVDILAVWSGGSLPVGDGTMHTPSLSDFNAEHGRMNWFGAQAWLNYLNVTGYKGYSDWRLANLGPARPAGTTCGIDGCFPQDPDFPVASSEWWRLFQEELGGVFGASIHDTHNANYALFSNFVDNATHTVPSSWGSPELGSQAHYYTMRGGQFPLDKSAMLRTLLVRTGQSVANPPPTAQLAINPVQLVFDVQSERTTSAARTASVTNTGTTNNTISGIVASADFAVTHDCPASLAPNASCTLNVTFSPSRQGQRFGNVTVNGVVPVRLALLGTGGLFASVTANSTSVTVGVPVTLTWTASVDDSSCEGTGGTAGDGWAGPLGPTGTRAVIASSPGAVSYGLRCTHSAQQLPPAESQVTVVHTLPTVTLTTSTTNVTVGDPITLSWTSANATACSASSNGAVWSGSRATSGSASISETTLGLISYMVTCTAADKSAQSSVQVMNNPRQSAGGGGSSSGGGGGRIDPTLLAGLLLLLGLQLRRLRRG